VEEGINTYVVYSPNKFIYSNPKVMAYLYIFCIETPTYLRYNSFEQTSGASEYLHWPFSYSRLSPSGVSECPHRPLNYLLQEGKPAYRAKPPCCTFSITVVYSEE
jgi:hypothetical protein